MYPLSLLRSMFHLAFSPRFYIGIALIVISFIIGNLAKFFFVIYFSLERIRWISLVVYVLSWLPLLLGIWWAGREAYEEISRYFSYH